MREGLARLLAEEGHEVVGSFGDAETLRPAVAETRPDVVIVDVRMPPSHTDEGMWAAKRIRKDFPAVGVLILSQHVEKQFAVELLSGDISGVGYLLKDQVVRVEEFLDALDRVGSGGSAFDPEVVRQLLGRTSHRDPLASLTEREREVLELMAQGHTNDAIAGRIYVSRSAVEKHVNAIFTKLGLTTGTDGFSRRVLAVLRYLDS